MFGENITSIAIVFMAMACAAGIAYVFIYPLLSGEAKAEKRMKTVGARPSSAKDRHAQFNQAQEQQKRRKQVQDTLKDVEERNKKKKISLRMRIDQAGLKWSMKTFYLISAAMAVATVFAGMVAGVPLNDCIRVIAAESAEPVKFEFRQIVEAQALGLSTAECVERLYERMPLAEVNFFTIVIAIQQKSGGNLAEALSNLSKVLRDRKKMRGEIVAMSQEAKASAAIIGALPIVVMVLVYLTSPQYISLLWTDKLGHTMLAGSAFWMFCGVMVMRKIINFDF